MANQLGGRGWGLLFFPTVGSLFKKVGLGKLPVTFLIATALVTARLGLMDGWMDGWMDDFIFF